MNSASAAASIVATVPRAASSSFARASAASSSASTPRSPGSSSNVSIRQATSSAPRSTSAGSTSVAVMLRTLLARRPRRFLRRERADALEEAAEAGHEVVRRDRIDVDPTRIGGVVAGDERRRRIDALEREVEDDVVLGGGAGLAEDLG